MFNMAISFTESAKQHDGKIIVVKGRQNGNIFGRRQFNIVELCGQQKIYKLTEKF